MLEPAYEQAWRSSRILCFDGLKRTFARREKCQKIFSKNITIDHVGRVTIELGDYYSFPDNFKKLFKDGAMALKSIFKIGLIANEFPSSNYSIEILSYTASKVVRTETRKKIEERDVVELVGKSKEDFLDSYRYKTIVHRSSHFLVFDMIFANPWNISVNYDDILQI